MAVVNAGDPVLGTVHKKGPNTILAIVIAALVGCPATLFWGWLTTGSAVARSTCSAPR